MIRLLRSDTHCDGIRRQEPMHVVQAGAEFRRQGSRGHNVTSGAYVRTLYQRMMGYDLHAATNRNKAVLRRSVLMAMVLALPACSTVTTSPGQTIAVMTEPAGAVCELRRDGAIISVVNPSPGTAFVAKSVRDIGVNCTAPGYHPGAAVISAQFQPMTVGNVLIGGLIGLAVDSASGAIAEYPRVVQIQLTPTRSTRHATLQDHYTTRGAEIARRAEQDVAAVQTTCRASDRPFCNSQIAEIRSRSRFALELNERDRIRLNSGT